MSDRIAMSPINDDKPFMMCTGRCDESSDYTSLRKSKWSASPMTPALQCGTSLHLMYPEVTTSQMGVRATINSLLCGASPSLAQAGNAMCK